MAVETFSDFLQFILWPHYITYLFYVAVKYTQFVFARCAEGYDLIDILLFLLSFLWCCCCCCCCCCYCAGDEENICSFSWKKAKHYRLILDRSLIKLLLGKQEGVVERFNTYRHDELDVDHLPKLYIRNKELTPYEAYLLALLILTFGILISITAFDLYFLDITHSCTEDPSLHCFVARVQYLSPNATELDPNVTNERVTDCQYWTSNDNISVGFTCFRWAFNSEITIGAVGGLITLFRIAVTITTGIFITGFEKLISRSTDMNGTIDIIKAVRVILAIVAGIIEICLATTFGISFAFLLSNDEGNPVTRFYRKHGNQLVLIFGILGTCLLLPLEEYARSSIEQQRRSGGRECNQPANNHSTITLSKNELWNIT